MTTEIDYNALGLARAGVPLRGYGQDEQAGTVNGSVQLYQRLRTRLDIFDESVVLTQFDSTRQPVRCFEVAPDSVAAALSGVPLMTGLLPDACLFYARDGVDPRIAVYLPPGRRDVTLVGGAKGERETLSLPTPPLVFVGEGRAYRMLAVMARPESDEALLYRAPFPNVHSDGEVCWGSVDAPACAADTIHIAAGLFLASEFNNHLIEGKSREHSNDVRVLWRALATDTENVYPVEDLVPSHKPGRMRDLWSSR